MSPFEAAVSRIGTLLGDLDRPRQVRFLSAAAVALLPALEAWQKRSENSQVGGDLFRHALEALDDYKRTSGITELPTLVQAFEEHVPESLGGDASFTAAQDCWILCDAAMRVALGEYEAAAAAWYLLEPLFQAVSEKTFGVTDVGSRDQREGEQAVLDDPQMEKALRSLTQALSGIQDKEINPSEREKNLALLLAPLLP